MAINNIGSVNSAVQFFAKGNAGKVSQQSDVMNELKARFDSALSQLEERTDLPGIYSFKNYNSTINIAKGGASSIV